VRGRVPTPVSAGRLAGVISILHAGNRCAELELAAAATSAGDSPLTVRKAGTGGRRGAVTEIAERASLPPGTVRTRLFSAVTTPDAGHRHTAVCLAHHRGWV
jgi:two-component system, NarL family, response regulator DesR